MLYAVVRSRETVGAVGSSGSVADAAPGSVRNRATRPSTAAAPAGVVSVWPVGGLDHHLRAGGRATGAELSP